MSMIHITEEMSFEEIAAAFQNGPAKLQAAALLLEAAEVGGDHHKQWYIDQALRAFLGAAYDRVVTAYERPQESGFAATWDHGEEPPYCGTIHHYFVDGAVTCACGKV